MVLHEPTVLIWEVYYTRYMALFGEPEESSLVDFLDLCVCEVSKFLDDGPHLPPSFGKVFC